MDRATPSSRIFHLPAITIHSWSFLWTHITDSRSVILWVCRIDPCPGFRRCIGNECLLVRNRKKLSPRLG